MFRAHRFPGVFVALFVLAGAAQAECLPIREARTMIQAGQVVPLLAAVRAARAVTDGEMIDGRLCTAGGGGYNYVVTFLRQNGRVARVLVDARSGKVLGVK